MQNKLLLLGIGVVVAVAAVGFFLTQASVKPPTVNRTRENPVPVETKQPGGIDVSTEAVQVREITVLGNEYSFSPASIELKSGEKTRITFKNVGSAPHDFVVAELGVKTVVISAGQEVSVEVTAPTTGEYTFFCSVDNHRALGMEGRMKVTQ